MTTREKLKKMLVDKGMFEDQAEEVMEMAIPKIEELTPGYRITWDRPADEYPAPLYSIFWLTLKEVAIKWIDANVPKAWYRPMFA